MGSVVCVVVLCDRPVKNHLRSLCNMHYQRWLKGNVRAGEPPRTPTGTAGALIVKTVATLPPAPCYIEWPFQRDKDGAPILYNPHTRYGVRAVRVAWELLHQKEMSGWALHHCNDSSCWNPHHVYDGDHAANQADRALAITHCKHDHEFTVENTYIRPNGSRACRTCMRERGREHDARRRPRTLPTGWGPNAKLTEDRVREIRRSDEHLSILSERFGVAPQTIYDVRTYRSWKHVD